MAGNEDIDPSGVEQNESEQLGLGPEAGQDKKFDRAAKWGDRVSMYRGSGVAGGGTDKKGRKGLIKRRIQYSMASGMLMVSLGLGGGAGLWMAGPGQLVMFAEIFKDFSLGGFDDDQDDFSNRLARRLLFNDTDSGERKLSLAGRKMYRNLAGGLQKTQGITFDTHPQTGDLTGIRKNGELVQDLTNNPDGSRVTQRAKRAALRTELRRAGVGKFSYYTRYRPLMQTRFRVKFSLFENSKARARQAAWDTRPGKWYQEKFKTQVVEGESIRTRYGGEVRDDDPDQDGIQQDGETLTDEELADQQAAADAEAAETTDAGQADNQEDLDRETADADNGSTAHEARTRSKGKLKLGAKGVLGFALIGCAIMGIQDNAEAIANAQRAVPMIRIANTFFAAAGQVQAGAVGALEEVGEAVKLLHSQAVTVVENGKEVIEPPVSWIDAQYSRMAIGSPWQGSKAMAQDLSPSKNGVQAGVETLVDAFKSLQLGPVCRAAGSTLGRIITTGFDLLNPASFVAGEILNRIVVGPLLEAFTRYLAGPGLDLDSFGPIEYAGSTMAGGILSASNSAFSMGGWLMDTDESNQKRAQHMVSRREEFAQRSLYDRIFDYSHPDSFITQATFKVPRTRQQVMLAITQAPKNFLAGLGAIIFPKIFAVDEACLGQTTIQCLEDFDNFGIEEAGFTEEDKQKILEYEPDLLVSWYLGESQEDGECASDDPVYGGGACEANPYDEQVPLSQDEREDLDSCFEPEGESPPDYEKDGCGIFNGTSDKALMFRGARMYVALGEGYACANDDPECPAPNSVPSNGADASCQQPSGTPQEVVNNVAFPIIHSIPGFEHETIEVNEAANAAHSQNTTSGNLSDHKGPPERAWATDISNGQEPTPEMDELAEKLATCFGIPWEGSGLVNHTANGYRMQLIYRTNEGGNHYNHVHFGVKKTE